LKRAKLLVIELHHQGDAVMSLPFVNAAAEIFDVTVCCRPGVGAIYEMALHPLEIIEWEAPWTGGRLASMPGMILKLIRTRFLAAVSVWSDTRVHLLMKLTGTSKRVGLPMNAQNYYGANIDWRRSQLRRGKCLRFVTQFLTGGPLLTHPVQRHNKFQHHLRDWAQVGEYLGLSPFGVTPWLRPGPLPEHSALNSVLEHARKNARKIWLVHTGGRLPTKRWPVERFEAVIERIFKPRQTPLIIVQPPGETVPVGNYAQAVTVAPKDVPSLAALVSSAERVLCNDSLASHLAAALDKPVITIFGSGNPAWFAPHGSTRHVVMEDVCPFHPCIDRCRMPSVACLESITVNRVLEAVEDLS
jgi:ADP-heptose:LPS heptosyltransferase